MRCGCVWGIKVVITVMLISYLSVPAALGQQPDPLAVESIGKAYELAQVAEAKLPDESGYGEALEEFDVAEALCEDQPAVLAELLRIRAALHTTFGYVERALADLERIDAKAASPRTQSFAELLRCKLLARQGRLDDLPRRLRGLNNETAAGAEAAELAAALPDIEKSWDLAGRAREALIDGDARRGVGFAEAAQRKWPENPLALAFAAVLAEDEPAWAKACTKARLVNRDLLEVLLVQCIAYEDQARSVLADYLKRSGSGLAPLKDSFVLNLGNGVTMELVRIPAGEFTMGSSKQGDEKPPHDVRITKPLYLGRTEVTQLQWTAVMGSNPSHFKGHPDLPVECVSWHDAQEFLRRLSSRIGRPLRLPTEAEWEYACRAGTTTAYSFGDDRGQLGRYGWLVDNSGDRTHPVGRKEPNPWGLYDVHGNVWEWCSDWYGSEYYEGSPRVDPVGVSSGNTRVLRGGSWYSNHDNLRSANRCRIRADSRSISSGFRVASGT